MRNISVITSSCLLRVCLKIEWTDTEHGEQGLRPYPYPHDLDLLHISLYLISLSVDMALTKSHTLF